MLQIERRATVADLRRIEALPENQDKRFELLHGEVAEVPAPSPLHGYISGKIYARLLDFAEDHDLGFAFPDSCSYTLDDAVEVIPDVSFVSKDKQPGFPLPTRFTIAPDLAVEVVSPSNRPRAILDKVEAYLSHGTRLVWVVYPENRVVDVCRRLDDGGLRIDSLDADGTLSGEDVLPGFTLPLAKIFPKQARPSESDSDQ